MSARVAALASMLAVILAANALTVAVGLVTVAGRWRAGAAAGRF